MPDRPGFELQTVDGRSIVRLRVRPDEAQSASAALQLPDNEQPWREDDPSIGWLGPDQWLLVSDKQAPEEMIDEIGRSLSGQLHVATDMSSGYACFELKGTAVRTVLAMGCGLDLHPDVFTVGRCARTYFAQIALFMVAQSNEHFDLYVDRSQARYFNDWLAAAGESFARSHS